MRKEAEAHAEEDKKLREQIELKNRADARVYETEKLMKEHKDIISGDQKKKLEDAIEKVKDALKRDDFEAMKAAEEQLTGVWHAVSSDIYSKVRDKTGAGPAGAAGAQGGPDAGPQPQGGEAKTDKKKDGDVVDADFEMVDEEKKK
jgi:molecular chaperone DnaK